MPFMSESWMIGFSSDISINLLKSNGIKFINIPEKSQSGLCLYSGFFARMKVINPVTNKGMRYCHLQDAMKKTEATNNQMFCALRFNM